MSYVRFAVYYLPQRDALAEFGAAWLGWDAVNGRFSDQPDVPGINEVTIAPRKYGFHATLKPPFKLRKGQDIDVLRNAVARMAAATPAAQCDGLELRPIGRFLALVPRGDTAGLGRVAATCVVDLDGFRAAASAAELARRRATGLTTRQHDLLVRWGYPYVMDEFRFHMTLTGKLDHADLDRWCARVAARLPTLPHPFVLDRIALAGERPDGFFELIQTYDLTG